eukprot:scaffold33588_cov128-Skeletonema_dohrnii-CCMP3373.AAC.11
MYTIDPSGGWRHRHVTIAAPLDEVQKESLYRRRQCSMLEEDLTNNDRTKSSGWRRALDAAMNAAITTFEKNEDNSNVDVLNKTEKYSAVVIF